MVNRLMQLVVFLTSASSACDGIASGMLTIDCRPAAGPEDSRCLTLIEAHKVCLRKQGFKVSCPGDDCQRLLCRPNAPDR